MCIQPYTCIYTLHTIHSYIQTHPHASIKHTHIHTHTYTHLWMNVCVRTRVLWMHVYACVRACVCVSLCVCSPNKPLLPTPCITGKQVLWSKQLLDRCYLSSCTVIADTKVLFIHNCKPCDQSNQSNPVHLVLPLLIPVENYSSSETHHV